MLLLQVNLHKIEEGVQELNGKMAHENEKLEQFSAVMSEVEGSFNEAKEANAAANKELEAKQEAFKAFERKDLKLREDMKHLGAKKKKTQQKKAKDEEKLKVRCPSFPSAPPLSQLSACSSSVPPARPPTRCVLTPHLICHGSQSTLAEAETLEQEVPELEEKGRSLTERQAEAEAKLEEMQSDIKGEVEQFSQKLQEVGSLSHPPRCCPLLVVKPPWCNGLRDPPSPCIRGP